MYRNGKEGEAKRRRRQEEERGKEGRGGIGSETGETEEVEGRGGGCLDVWVELRQNNNYLCKSTAAGGLLGGAGGPSSCKFNYYEI